MSMPWKYCAKNSGAAKEGDRHLYMGGNFELQMYFYYTNRGAHIYIYIYIYIYISVA